MVALTFCNVFGSLLVPILAARLLMMWQHQSSSLLSPLEHQQHKSNVVFGSGEMFDQVAPYYDLANRCMSLGQDQSWRQSMLHLMVLQPSDSVLDLATGSADVAIAAAKNFHVQSVIGLDPSKEMLKVAQDKVHQAGLTDRITLVHGDAQDLHIYSNATFDKITMSFGIRNVPNRILALQEMRRVLKKEDGSRLAIMEFSAPSTNTLLGQAATWFLRYVLPYIGGFVAKSLDEYRYLEESIFNFPGPTSFVEMIESTGFEVIQRQAYMAEIVNIYIAKPI